MRLDGILPMVSAGAAASASLMLVLWLRHLRTGNAAIVDVGWAIAVGLQALAAGALGPGDPVRRAIVAALGGAWSLRLALHLAHRVASEPEDGRYAELRVRWGGNLAAKFLVFFLAQGALAVLLAVPFFVAAADRSVVLHPLVWGAVGLACASVVGEAIADAQLRRFKADPANRGRVCRVGLWGWSRHPNYFFEWLIWCAFALLALPSPAGWLASASPALMLYFLLRVTGIPATEAHALRSRGAAYGRYQQEVSAFVPLPPTMFR